MSFRIREVVDWALGAEAGISDSGGKLSLQLATMHYDFTRTALGEEGVESAEVDFEIAEVSLDEGQIPAELRLTINSNIHRVMASGEKKLHMSASETLAIPLTVLDSPES